MLKRCALILMALAVAAALYGCGSPDAVEVEPTDGVPDITPTPTPTPTPAPTSTPIQLLAPSEIIYAEIVNTTVDIRFYCPINWVSVPTKRTAQYEEPTPEGTTPAMLAITYKPLKQKLNTRGMRTQMAAFFDIIGRRYDTFTPGEVSEKVKALNTEGYRQRYTAITGEGEELAGYVLLCYTENDKRLYLVHFLAPTERYEALDDTWTQVLKSIRRA